jgi:TolA-binding protein
MTASWKPFLAPCITVIFVAGGGWVTLEAVAQQNTDLTERVEVVEDKVGQQQVIDLKVEQVEQRLQRLETAIEKMIEIQQKQAVNQAAICQATAANCR